MKANFNEAALYLSHYYIRTKQNLKADEILKDFRQKIDKYTYTSGETLFKVLDVINRIVMGKAYFLNLGKMFTFGAGFNELARALVLCNNEERGVFYDAFFDYVKEVVTGDGWIVMMLTFLIFGVG